MLMKNITHRIVGLAFAVALTVAVIVAFGGAAYAQEVIPVTAVTVAAAKPTKADIARLKQTLDLSSLTDQEIEDKHPVYIVKVFTRLLPGAAQVVLSIGSTAVPQFGTFKDGIFLRVYDPARIGAWSGQPVKLIRRGPRGEEPAVDAKTLIRFPAQPAAAAGATRKSVDEVLKGG